MHSTIKKLTTVVFPCLAIFLSVGLLHLRFHVLEHITTVSTVSLCHFLFFKWHNNSLCFDVSVIKFLFCLFVQLAWSSISSQYCYNVTDRTFYPLPPSPLYMNVQTTSSQSIHLYEILNNSDLL